MKRSYIAILLLLFISAIAVYLLLRIDEKERTEIREKNKAEVIDGKVNFIIEPEFEKYLHGLDVWAKLKIINKSSEPIKFVLPFEIKYLKIIGPKGNDLTHYRQWEYLNHDTLTLYPGQSIERITIFNEVFPLDFYYGLKDYGSYEVSSQINGVESNIAIINLLPRSREDIAYIRELEKTWKELHREGNPDDVENLIRTHLNSPYTPKHTYELIIHYENKLKNYEKVEELFNFYFEHFNNFYNPFVTDAYKSFLGFSLNLPANQIEEKINSIKSKYEGSKMVEAMILKEKEMKIKEEYQVD